MTPAGTSNELDVQNKWEENTHTHNKEVVTTEKKPNTNKALHNLLTVIHIQCILCMVITCGRVWTNNRVRLPILLVVSRTGKMNIPLSQYYVPENLVSRDGFSRPVPRHRVHLRIQAESGAYLRDSSRVPRRRPFTYIQPPYTIGSVPSLSGHAIIAYRWRSLPRVRRHRASTPQGSSERVLPWQVTMVQLICASLSLIH